MNRLSFLPFLTLVPLAASAQSFSENFDADHTSQWSFNSSLGSTDLASDNTGSEANFFFDYSTVGIPSAPHSVGSTTIGLKLEANVYGSPITPPLTVPGIFSGVSVSPIGKTFSGSYTLSFDAWQNFTGPLPGGGNGTTQFMLGGIGSAETTAQFPGGTFNGVGFAASADGGSNTDYRAYNAPGAPLVPGTFDSTNTATYGVYGAGTTTGAGGAMDSANSYYSRFSGTVPAAQTTYAANTLQFASQTGTTVAGSTGFAWHTWSIAKVGTTVSWSVDGLLFATVYNSSPAGGDIFLGQFDSNNGASTQSVSRMLNFGLIDNVTVTQAVPEPSAFAALGLGAIAFVRRRRK